MAGNFASNKRGQRKCINAGGREWANRIHAYRCTAHVTVRHTRVVGIDEPN